MSKIKQFFKQQDIKNKTILFEKALFSDDTIPISESILSDEDKQELMSNLFDNISVSDNSQEEENIIEELFNNILELPDNIDDKETKEVTNVIKEVNKQTNHHKENIKKEDLFDIIVKESLKPKEFGLFQDKDINNDIEDINSLDLKDTDKLKKFLKKLIEQINLIKKQPKQFASGGGGALTTKIVDLEWNNIEW